MLGSITPLGERGRNSTWGVTVTALLIGATAGGAGTGWLAGSIGALLRRPLRLPGGAAPVVLLGLVAAGLALDSGWFGARVPGPRRQVNEDWLRRYRGWVYGGGFGLQLGSGVVTVVSISAVYTMIAAALLSGSPWWGAVIGAAFGAVRGATAFGVAGVDRPQRLVGGDRTLRRWDRPARRIALTAEAGLLAAGVAGLLVR